MVGTEGVLPMCAPFSSSLCSANIMGCSAPQGCDL
jgi:hypothetical protein